MCDFVRETGLNWKTAKRYLTLFQEMECAKIEFNSQQENFFDVQKNKNRQP